MHEEQIPIRPDRVKRAKALARRMPMNTALESYVIDKTIESPKLLEDLRGADAWLPTTPE